MVAERRAKSVPRRHSPERHHCVGRQRTPPPYAAEDIEGPSSVLHAAPLTATALDV